MNYALKCDDMLCYGYDSLANFVQILEFVDDPKTFVRASSVSRRWREIVSDDQAWKTLCDKHAYRRMSSDSIGQA